MKLLYWAGSCCLNFLRVASSSLLQEITYDYLALFLYISVNSIIPERGCVCPDSISKRNPKHWKDEAITCTFTQNTDDNVRVYKSVPIVSDNKNIIDVNVRFC